MLYTRDLPTTVSSDILSYMFRRLKNLWAWSSYHPSGPPQTITSMTLDYRGKVKPVMTIDNMREMLDLGKETTEIIYPNKRTELLRVNQEPSLDDLLKP